VASFRWIPFHGEFDDCLDPVGQSRHGTIRVYPTKVFLPRDVRGMTTEMARRRLIPITESHLQGRRPASRRPLRLRFRETMATLALGSGSLCLAIVMLVAIMAGLFGRAIEPWTEPRFVWVEKAPPEFVLTRDPLSNEYESTRVLVPSRQIAVPSRECHLLAFLSLVLGGIGLLLSIRRRYVSWVSFAGFTLTFLMMGTVVACEMLFRISL
jgi:hypothetical protein